jgi:hypothetical protein
MRVLMGWSFDGLVGVCVCVCVCVCGQSSKHTASDTLTPHMSGGFTVSKKLRKL